MARSWPPMSPKWLEFLVGMVWMEQWDLGDMSDVIQTIPTRNCSHFGDIGGQERAVEPPSEMGISSG